MKALVDEGVAEEDEVPGTAGPEALVRVSLRVLSNAHDAHGDQRQCQQKEDSGATSKRPTSPVLSHGLTCCGSEPRPSGSGATAVPPRDAFHALAVRVFGFTVLSWVRQGMVPMVPMAPMAPMGPWHPWHPWHPRRMALPLH